jgi:hypothetical protein
MVDKKGEFNKDWEILKINQIKILEIKSSITEIPVDSSFTQRTKC